MAEMHKGFGDMGKKMACYLEVLCCWTTAMGAPKVGPSICSKRAHGLARHFLPQEMQVCVELSLKIRAFASLGSSKF